MSMKIKREINGEIVEIEITHDEIREGLEQDGYWGIVMWCDEDIRCALEDAGFEPTDERISRVKDGCSHIQDGMIERGWEFIDHALNYLPPVHKTENGGFGYDY